MRIAVFNQHLAIGGAETFLCSLLPAMVEAGFQVDFFALDARANEEQVDRLKCANINLFLGRSSWPARNAWPAYDAAFATNPATLMAVLAEPRLRIHERVKLIPIVLQTMMFCLPPRFCDLHNRISRAIFCRVPRENIVFVNSACRRSHEIELSENFEASHILPLVVDGTRYLRRPPLSRRGDQYRIVSVGRLEPFKSYNLTMLDAIVELKSRGLNVTWDVYGTGTLFAAMQAEIDARSLSNQVFLRGNIDYADIPATLVDAFAFVGSGLSVMEAAAAGVPSIPAIEYATAAESFGFIAEIQGDSFFEPSLGLQRKSIADLIVRLAQLDPPSYEKLGSACRQRMEPFFPMTLAESYKKTIDTASPGILPISIADMVGYRVSAWLFSQVKGFVQRIRLLFFRRGR